MGESGRRVINPPAATAASLGLLACHACGLLSRAAPHGEGARCPSCQRERNCTETSSSTSAIIFSSGTMMLAKKMMSARYHAPDFQK